MDALYKVDKQVMHPLVQPRDIVAVGGSADFLKPLLTFFDHTHNDQVSYVILRGDYIRVRPAEYLY